MAVIKRGKMSRRAWEEIHAAARKDSASLHALTILEGYVPCPYCKGSRIAAFQHEAEIGERMYHFKRECRFCLTMERPGYFSPQEAMAYGLDNVRRQRSK